MGAKQFDRQLAGMKVGETLADVVVSGLRFRRRKTGTYAELRYKWHGAWKATPVGKLGSVGLIDGRPGVMPGEKALGTIREEAKELGAKIARGIDPALEADWQGFTLKEALELHLEGGERSARTEEEYRGVVERHFKDWKGRALASLGREEVRKRHRDITASAGPYAANGAMRVLRAVYNRARRQYPELPEAPTANVDWHREERRDAAIPLAELPSWYAEVVALKNAVRRDFYLVTVLTGLRRRTADRIRVGDVDLDNRVLHVPLPKGGAKRAFDIPLSDWLVTIIRDRIGDNARFWREANKWRAHKGKPPVEPNDYLFPAHGKSGHIEEPKANDGEFAVAFTVHGLRNTFISAGVATAVHTYHIKLLANHKLPKGDVTAGYVGKDVDALRPSQQRITDWLRAAMMATLEASNVVALRG